MLIVTHDTIANSKVLETRSLPKKFFGRVQLIPRNGGLGLWARLIVEMQLVRYIFALLPFVAIPFMSTELALPVTQAPLAMFLVIGIVEMKVLRLSKAGQEGLMSEDEAARILDAFAFRARAALRRIAAHRALSEGELTLVLEQSELARVAPLTLVSVQSPTPGPHVVDLGHEERVILTEALFDQDLTERMLHNASLRTEIFIHEVKIAAQSVSAHARLAAALERSAAEPVEA